MENDCILLSVIVPVYNTKKQLRKCLDSIVGQTYSNLEIILVDDGSTDGCFEICDEYAEQDERIKVIHKENGGLVSARKAGARKVTGDYVISVDSDDWMEQDYLQKFIVEIVKTGKKQIWSSGYYRDYEERSFVQRVNTEKEDIADKITQDFLCDKALGKYGYSDDIPYYMWTKCVERDLFLSIYLSIDERINYAEDFAFSIRSLAINREVSFIDNCGYHYVQRNNSVSRLVSSREIEQIEIMRDETNLFLKKCDDYVYTNRVVEGVYITAMVVRCFDYLQKADYDYLYPFDKIKKGSKVIIYGLGNVGQNIYKYLEKSYEYEVVACTDMQQTKSEMVKKYIEIKEIHRCIYDFVLICTVKANLIRDIICKLLEMGISKEKIVYLPVLGDIEVQ